MLRLPSELVQRRVGLCAVGSELFSHLSSVMHGLLEKGAHGEDEDDLYVGDYGIW